MLTLASGTVILMMTFRGLDGAYVTQPTANDMTTAESCERLRRAYQHDSDQHPELAPFEITYECVGGARR